MRGTRLRTTTMAATMAMIEEGVQPSAEDRPGGPAALGACGVSRVVRNVNREWFAKIGAMLECVA
jgi:hypothetical protein